MADDTEMQDADAVAEDELQYGHGVMTEEELNEKYPNRPHNLHKTLRFSELFTTVFNPLSENRKRPAGPLVSRKKLGPHGGSAANMSPNEIRRNIIERFISRWRKEVGNDIYPAFRLIMPDKDRDRATYGLKEKTIAKILVKVLRIDEHSEDGFNLLNWKLPGQQAAAAMAGDFAGRCYDVIAKRPFRDRTTPGNMTIAEVNERLDSLSMMSKEEEQRDVFEQFYRKMNAEEMLWLIRIILRQMKVGATEKTFFEIWHPDADSLFNVSSSLRRVCWELSDPNTRLDKDSSGVSLMQCFQPQLAAFQMHSLEKLVAKMRPSEEDDMFWIEEKLDGERMQLHMAENEDVPGGIEFKFWSRKAKDYTYLYGSGFQDDNSALTRHLKNAFKEGVRNIILDGEMITWDEQEKAMVPFGTLKSAAISQQANPFSGGQRPLYRVFDCLYLNDTPITDYTLRDRRAALDASVESVEGRLEIHKYTVATTVSDIEKALRQVVAESSEGLVVKNPRSKYRLNERNDDWAKVKPEYMTEFGEALDCVVVGGYYGSGHRGGRLSSFLCGLRVDDDLVARGANPQLCYSFFKVGGGMTAGDYAQIRHHTDGKWIKFEAKSPPSEYLLLAGNEKLHEKPDVWIKPSNSVVVSVKAASVGPTDQFKMGVTLRFPRFKRLRLDKDWKSALSIQGFIELKNNAEQEKREKEFEVDDARRQKRIRTTRKKPVTLIGSETVSKPYSGPTTALFDGLTFFIVSESMSPKKSVAELKELVKNNGGSIVLKEDGKENVICITDRKNFKTASLLKHGKHNLVRPAWILDCLAQHEIDAASGKETFLLPMEPQHMFYATDDDVVQFEHNVDQFGDSYARDCTVEELRKMLDGMIYKKEEETNMLEASAQFLWQMEERGVDLEDLPGMMFRHAVVYLDTEDAAAKSGLRDDHIEEGGPVKSIHNDVELSLAGHLIIFAGGEIMHNLDNADITHVVVGKDRSRLKGLRAAISSKQRVPRIVTEDWINESWEEKTLLDEERYLPV